MTRPSNRTYTTQMPGEVPPTDQQGEEIVGLGADDQVLEIGGQTFPLNEVVSSAFETSGMSVSEWNALPAEQRDIILQAQIAEIESISVQVADRGVPMTRAPRSRKQAAEKPVTAKRAGKLPEPHEVDPAKITAMVRTTQGWVIPSKPIRVPQRGD
jgi:hypothetical protein